MSTRREKMVSGWLVYSERMNGDIFCPDKRLLSDAVRTVSAALRANESLTVTRVTISVNAIGHETDAREILR